MPHNRRPGGSGQAGETRRHMIEMRVCFVVCFVLSSLSLSLVLSHTTLRRSLSAWSGSGRECPFPLRLFAFCFGHKHTHTHAQCVSRECWNFFFWKLKGRRRLRPEALATEKNVFPKSGPDSPTRLLWTLTGPGHSRRTLACTGSMGKGSRQISRCRN